uniref:Uncharacterized protein n=1 Tax=Acanthochromis polyacanthus TaxID=80966 RepID=A0A3Q1EYI1_9TELE
MAFLIQNPRSRVCFRPRKACCGRPRCAALYNTSLPTMTPTTKKSMMRAIVRALNPSSFFMSLTSASWTRSSCWTPCRAVSRLQRDTIFIPSCLFYSIFCGYININHGNLINSICVNSSFVYKL